MPDCKYCDEALIGRADKKYCNQYCKSAHQYEKRKLSEGIYLNIDRTLKKNRKILKAYNKNGFSTVRQNELIAQGFNPKFFTHYYKTKSKKVYLFCYEYGFSSIQHNGKPKFLLVQWQDYMGEL